MQWESHGSSGAHVVVHGGGGDELLTGGHLAVIHVVRIREVTPVGRRVAEARIERSLEEVAHAADGVPLLGLGRQFAIARLDAILLQGNRPRHLLGRNKKKLIVSIYAIL